MCSGSCVKGTPLLQVALYCVFDGHCGRKTASNCTKMLPEELRKRMAEMKPRLDSGEGGGQIWEEVFLATDAALETEDGATATAVLVWKDDLGNICLQVWPHPWSWRPSASSATSLNIIVKPWNIHQRSWKCSAISALQDSSKIKCKHTELRRKFVLASIFPRGYICVSIKSRSPVSTRA